MKKNKFIAILLTLVIALSPLSAYARTVELNTLLRKVTRPNLTSLQRLDIIETYKGKSVRGEEKVKDIRKSLGSEKNATILLQKRYKGKEYDIVLTTSELEKAKKITKGKRVKFVGKFVGMTFETVRFENVKIVQKARLWPF